MAEDPAQCPADDTSEHPSRPYLRAYRHIRLGIEELVEGRPAATLPVPACVGWTVRDTVEHLVRNCRAAECNLCHTVRRTQVPLDRAGLPDLFAEWDRSALRVEEQLRRISHGKTGSVLIMDAFSHHLDIAVALGEPFPLDHPALPLALPMAVEGFSAAVCWRGLPPLRLATPDTEWTAGYGHPEASVLADPRDLYRSLTGRRTVEQIWALKWSADPATWLPAFGWGSFRLPAAKVERCGSSG